jgi:NitT/TauT family transport system ATP-binding protein
VLVMTAAPGRIKAEISIPFARPRSAYELMRNPQFGELTYEIWEALRDEVNSVRASEHARR